MRFRALTALLLTGLSLTAFAQIDYHPLEVGKKPDKPKGKSAKLPVWSLKPGAVSQLAPEKALFGWVIRPPKGYVFTQRADGLNQVYIFQGDPHPDGSSPAIWIVTGDARRVQNMKAQDEVVMDQYMIQLHTNRDNWKESPIERGLIQGRQFVRRRWSATQNVNGTAHRLHGIVYMHVSASKFAALTCVDSDPYSNKTLGIMEPSLLTFHKR